MKISTLKWAKCPYCDILINGFDYYPASIIMGGDSTIYRTMTCPNTKCLKSIHISCKVDVVFKTKKVKK